MTLVNFISPASAAKSVGATQENPLRLLTGDSHPLYLNVFRHNGHSGKPLGFSYDEYRGQYALASAAEDARAPGYNDGAMRYETSIKINPDGTWEMVELS